MTIYTAPAPLPNLHHPIFLAGGISNCPNWQSIMENMLTAELGQTVDLLNPRRDDYPDTEAGAVQQIEWEHDALHRSEVVLFWFPKDTLCPITLFELGTFAQRKNIPIFVGTDPDYARKLDVITQLRLARPEIQVVHSLEALSNQVIQHYKA